MSTTTTTTPGAPFQQWQNFYPANAAYPGYPGFPGGNYPYDAPTSINTDIYANVMGNSERTKDKASV